MPIQIGQIAYLKTTNEEVTVLAIENAEPRMMGFSYDFSALSGREAVVRRAIASDKGIFYSVERFLLEELETLEERITRDYNNRLLAKTLMEKLVPRTTPAGQADMLKVPSNVVAIH